MQDHQPHKWLSDSIPTSDPTAARESNDSEHDQIHHRPHQHEWQFREHRHQDGDMGDVSCVWWAKLTIQKACRWRERKNCIRMVYIHCMCFSYKVTPVIKCKSKDCVTRLFIACSRQWIVSFLSLQPDLQVSTSGGEPPAVLNGDGGEWHDMMLCTCSGRKHQVSCKEEEVCCLMHDHTCTAPVGCNLHAPTPHSPLPHCSQTP